MIDTLLTNEATSTLPVKALFLAVAVSDGFKLFRMVCRKCSTMMLKWICAGDEVSFQAKPEKTKKEYEKTITAYYKKQMKKAEVGLGSDDLFSEFDFGSKSSSSNGIDCMHWEWINYAKAWHGQFGKAGANNNLTVLNHSPLFDDLLDDIALVVPYEVNGVTFEKGYHLADGIYPQWATFIKSFTVARDEKNAVFKRRQESARKDVERAFGVLQGRWHIIAQPKFVISEVDDIYICPQPNLARTWIKRCEVQRKKAKEHRYK
ncbi:ALP1-like protein isoform X1 [Tanacetum coccineum]